MDGPGLDSGDFCVSEVSISIDSDFNETVNVLEFMSVANVVSFVTLFKMFLRKVAMLGFFALGFRSVESEELRGVPSPWNLWLRSARNSVCAGLGFSHGSMASAAAEASTSSDAEFDISDSRCSRFGGRGGSLFIRN